MLNPVADPPRNLPRVPSAFFSLLAGANQTQSPNELRSEQGLNPMQTITSEYIRRMMESIAEGTHIPSAFFSEPGGYGVPEIQQHAGLIAAVTNAAAENANSPGTPTRQAAAPPDTQLPVFRGGLEDTPTASALAAWQRHEDRAGLISILQDGNSLIQIALKHAKTDHQLLAGAQRALQPVAVRLGALLPGRVSYVTDRASIDEAIARQNCANLFVFSVDTRDARSIPRTWALQHMLEVRAEHWEDMWQLLYVIETDLTQRLSLDDRANTPYLPMVVNRHLANPSYAHLNNYYKLPVVAELSPRSNEAYARARSTNVFSYFRVERRTASEVEPKQACTTEQAIEQLVGPPDLAQLAQDLPEALKAKLREAADKVERFYADTSAMINKINAHIPHLTADLKNKNEQLAAARERNKKIAEQRDGFSAEVVRLTKKLEVQQRERQELETELETAQARVRELEGAVTGALGGALQVRRHVRLLPTLDRGVRVGPSDGDKEDT